MIKMLMALLTLVVICGACRTTGDLKQASSASASWSQFVDAYIEAYFKANPTEAVKAGRHEYDGQLPDWSSAGLKNEIARLKRALSQASAFDPAQLSSEEQFQRSYFIATVKGALFWAETADQPHLNPAYYMNNGLDPNVYIGRPYASAELRFKAFLKYLDAIPLACEQIQNNLKAPLPATFVDYGKSAFEGMAAYYLGDGKTAFAKVKDSKLQAQLDKKAKVAAEAMRELAQSLEAQRSVAAQNYAWGAQKFAQMLRDTEMVDTPLADLEAVGWTDLRRNQAALKDACGVYAKGATIPECLGRMNNDKDDSDFVDTERAQLKLLKNFVVQRDLVSVPGDEEPLVQEAPPYSRKDFGFIDLPGPYEKRMPLIYSIAPPDPSWPKKVQQGFIPSKADLLVTSVHAVWPGHLVAFLHGKQSKWLFGRLFAASGLSEGWAQYTEEMMWEAGLAKGDVEAHIGQLIKALNRNCRFIAAIGLHTGSMTMSPAQDLFRNECYQDDAAALRLAASVTYDPRYVAFTLGKLMIRKLREDWTSTRGGRNAWKAFHDEFLSHGGPPIPLIRQQMLGGEAKAEF